MTKFLFKFLLALLAKAVAFAGVANAAQGGPQWIPERLLIEMKSRAQGGTQSLAQVSRTKLSSRQIDGPPKDNVRWIKWNDPLFHITGDLKQVGPHWPGQFFGAPRSVTYGPGERLGNATAVHTCTNSPWIDVFQLGSGFNSQLSVFVDRQRLNRKPIEFPPNGALYLTRIDFGSAARRCVRFLFNAPAFGGVFVAPSPLRWDFTDGKK